jgi:hypothetical protein
MSRIVHVEKVFDLITHILIVMKHLVALKALILCLMLIKKSEAATPFPIFLFSITKGAVLFGVNL